MPTTLPASGGRLAAWAGAGAALTSAEVTVAGSTAAASPVASSAASSAVRRPPETLRSLMKVEAFREPPTSRVARIRSLHYQSRQIAGFGSPQIASRLHEDRQTADVVRDWVDVPLGRLEQYQGHI